MGAMHEEIESLENNGTWDVVCLPTKKKTVKCKRIFKRIVCLPMKKKTVKCKRIFKYGSK
jgi:hypothetical protein